MKVLVASVPQAGHLNPMLPLVGALRAGGDDVLIASGADLRTAAEAAGAQFRAVGHGMPDWFGRLAGRIRGNPGDGLPPERIGAYFIPRLFAEIAADDVIDDLVATAREFGPDLLIFDQAMLAAPLAARLAGVPAVQHLFGPPHDPDVLRLVSDAIAPLWRSFGLDVPPHAGVYDTATVAICPPALAPAGIPAGEVLQLRPTPLPTTNPVAPARPLVYVTMGTQWADAAMLRTILTALGGEPLDVIATVGQALDVAELGQLPANVRVERYLPQAKLLPACSAVVHHAGAGTMFGALAHGLPQLALPQAADNFVNADALARSGAALVLRPGQVDKAAVRDGVRTALADAEIGEAARAIAAQIATMPAPGEVAAQLHDLA